MANNPKAYVCKYCGKETIITRDFKHTCSHCKSRHALIRRPEHKEPMANTRLMNETEKMNHDE